MTLVVGLPRDARRTTSVLQLAALLARSTGDELVVCSVLPAPWPPGPARIDTEYREHVGGGAHRALDAARLALPADLPVTTEVSTARSTPAGLLEVAGKHRAAMLVLGSAPPSPPPPARDDARSPTGPPGVGAGSARGRVSLGGVAERVLHSSPVPVALAPRGFRCRPKAVLTRVTAAYGPGEGSDAVVARAAALAVTAGVGLRLASFAVWPGTMITAGVGRAETGILAEWSRDIERAQSAALDRVAALPAPPGRHQTAVGHGRDWDQALADIGWADGDLLVVGSSSDGPLARVFLGSRASKIIRNSPVPVVAAPRAEVVAG